MFRISSLLYSYLIVFLTFGVFGYDFISSNLGFTYIDEILVVILFVLYLLAPKDSRFLTERRSLTITCGIFLLFLITSLFAQTNTYLAVIFDFITHIKTYLAFFIILSLPFELNDRQKIAIKRYCLCLGVFLVLVYLTDSVFFVFAHPSRFATSAIAIGLLYYYCSEDTRKDKIVSFILILLSSLSFRAKAYTFIAVFIACVFFFKGSYIYASKIKKIFLVILLLLLVFAAGWSKFSYYFIQGTEGLADVSSDSEIYARPALYIGAIENMKAYPIFGSGFGTFGTFASAHFYSPLYDRYELSSLWGLSREMPDFIADTYFPSLSQFGILGVFFFFYFWYYVYMRGKFIYEYTNNEKIIKTTLLIIVFFMIESSSDTTITHNRGVFIMMILAMALNRTKVLIDMRVPKI